MSLPIILADQRLAERRGIKAAIFGRSGIGKTSLLWTLPPDTTLVDPGSSVRFEGRELLDVPTHARARLGIGYLPQEVSIFRGLSVEDNIKAILWTLAIFFFIRTFLFEAYRIPSGSMQPTLLVGDWLFGGKVLRQRQRRGLGERDAEFRLGVGCATLQQAGRGGRQREVEVTPLDADRLALLTLQAVLRRRLLHQHVVEEQHQAVLQLVHHPVGRTDAAQQGLQKAQGRSAAAVGAGRKIGGYIFHDPPILTDNAGPSRQGSVIEAPEPRPPTSRPNRSWAG